MGIVITNIQRMCFQDGPGIRTTVFLKGCSIRCPWCSNPENLSFEPQLYYEEARCRKEGNSCVFNEQCGVCTDEDRMQFAKRKVLECPIGAIGQYGKEVEPEELVRELLKDKVFWGEEGGVTFSGGEALMQADKLLPVLESLKKSGIHTAVETGLFVPESKLRLVMDLIDFYYVDIKLLDKETCKAILGGEIEQYLSNVNLLSEEGKNLNFRIPCSEEYTLQPHNLGMIYRFCEKYRKYPVQLFAVHGLGESKYRSLGLSMQKTETVSDARLEQVQAELWARGCRAERISI